jgi:hypothetical protein
MIYNVGGLSMDYITLSIAQDTGCRKLLHSAETEVMRDETEKG